jgi:hypothetical protein
VQMLLEQCWGNDGSRHDRMEWSSVAQQAGRHGPSRLPKPSTSVNNWSPPVAIKRVPTVARGNTRPLELSAVLSLRFLSEEYPASFGIDSVLGFLDSVRIISSLTAL